MFRTRNDAFEIAHHLAAIAHTQAEGIRTREILGELIAQIIMVQNSFRPAFTRAQHVTVGEATARCQPFEVLQMHTTGEQITHVYVHRVKTRRRERRRHLDVAVHALLTQDRNFRFCAQIQVWRRSIDVRRKSQFRGQCFRCAAVFLLHTRRIVAQFGDVERSFLPRRMHHAER